LQWVDQFGEVVDLYDFAGHGKPVVVDLSAMWCGWCHELSYWLDHQPSADDFLFPPEYEVIREALARGDLYWITVLDGTATGSPPDLTTAELYHEMHPNDHVTLLVDHEREFGEYVFGSGWTYWPSLTLLDEHLEPIVLPDLYAEEDALSVLSELFAD
jgi:thiol-disulfide isomerase/thioredoxin